ncbi:hypothetical protein HanPSC8_Chr09g0355131 [Helianthus annuus]|nr:hypothetical protein HanLR1_Chr09g0302701 [Helianthus annuus]KAJ0891536.1 hypothetical protein HanPSC8_Chr09g0355131 [Helianthus annuus]
MISSIVYVSVYCYAYFDCLCFIAAASKSARSSSKIDISKITHPASPPSKPLDLSPPRPDPKGKGKEDDIEVERTEIVVENVAAGTGRDEVHAEGVETKAMGEDTLEFEDAKRAFAEEREAFNADKKGLLWRVVDAKEKLAKEKQYNADRQKEWESACERSNRELKAARYEIVQLKGEKTKQSDEHEQDVAVYQKRENEYTHRLANLEKSVAERTAESKASEILDEEIGTDCKWLLARSIANRIVKSDELAKYMFKLGEAAYNSGHKDGYGEGRAAAAANKKDYHFELYKEDCTAAYATKHQEYEFLEFAIVRAVEKLSRKGGAIKTLKKALGDQDPETEGAGPSHQV